ncbi:MAG: urease accessory UreF family protein [Nitrososphaerales archaeon]
MNVSRESGNSSLLSIMQLSDSFFPTGMYTMSNGLEMLFYQNKVKRAEQLERLIHSYLRMQVGVTDCVALGNAIDAAKESNVKTIIETDQTLYVMKLVKATREAYVRSGIQLVNCVDSFTRNNSLNRYKKAIGDGKATGVYPVALGVVCSACEISKPDAAFVLLYSSSVSLVGAALRLGMIDHNEGQKIIHDMKPTILEVAKNVNKPLRSMWQFFPVLDIAQMMHERYENKMFLT